MLHKNPQLIDLQLQRENVRRRHDAEAGLPQLEYFIPFCFLTRLSEKIDESRTEEIAQANQLREDFHDFVFIHATRQQIAHLTDGDWNSAMRSHLHHYRDVRHRAVFITETEKDHLISIFAERRLRFSIGLPVPNLGPDVKVEIRKEGTFKGRIARIIEVRHTPGGISLKLGLPMFNGMKELKLPDFTLADIQAQDATAEIIGTVFVQDCEKKLTDILERRVRHTETDQTRSQDATTLNHTFLYSCIAIHDPQVSARFHALMLICATLRFDRESLRALTTVVRDHLTQGHDFPSDLQALLNFALYIATRDADYRTAGKQCLHQHPDCATDTLRRLMSLVGSLRSKRKRHSKC